MNKYINTFLAAAAVVGFSSCNDYLNQEPEDKVIPENFFTSEAMLRAYTLNFYTILPSHSDNSYGLGTFQTDDGTDNQAGASASTRWVPGEWRTGQSTQNWNFGNLRSLNYFINNANEAIAEDAVSGDEALIEQAMGEAYFFRAYTYWTNYNMLGDWPIIDEVLPDDMETLLQMSKRQPRNKVARHILDDLTTAISLLPESSSYGKNGLTKDCARLLRSRVALFEGTWLKHHKGTALVPGGPGWPGDASLLEGFDIDSEINYFLKEAMASGKEVGDKYLDKLANNTDTPEGMTAGFTEANPYYCMFCVDNPGKYDEVLLYRAYNLTQNLSTQIQAQFQKNAGGTGWTRGMVNSFLMRNGLPIYDANSGYDPAWENQGVTATLQNRDSRIQIFTKQDNSVISLGLTGADPMLYNSNWLFNADAAVRCTTGFPIKKGQDYNYVGAQGNLQSTTGSIVFRATEALLNYMEACVELNGNVDNTADGYWKAIRSRAKVDTDYSKTIAATVMSKEAEGDWGAYSHGSLIEPLLYNVRRERRNELCAEALRLDDLRRWCALDQMISTPYQIEGMKYWGTVYEDPNSPMCIKTPEGAYWAPVVSIENSDGTMSPRENSLYVRPYQRTKVNNLVYDGYKFTRAHYLSPIGYEVFVNASSDKNEISTTVVYQNPGWPVKANEGATSLD